MSDLTSFEGVVADECRLDDGVLACWFSVPGSSSTAMGMSTLTTPRVPVATSEARSSSLKPPQQQNMRALALALPSAAAAGRPKSQTPAELERRVGVAT